MDIIYKYIFWPSAVILMSNDELAAELRALGFVAEAREYDRGSGVVVETSDFKLLPKWLQENCEYSLTSVTRFPTKVKPENDFDKHS